MNTQKPIKIHKSLDPTWVKFSASVPGIANTQWFDSETEAAEFIRSNGFAVFDETKHGSITISKSEHAALCAVAEAAKELYNYCMNPAGKTAYEDSLIMTNARVSLAQLAAIRGGGK